MFPWVGALKLYYSGFSDSAILAVYTNVSEERAGLMIRKEFRQNVYN
jgi:hypothetical protein